MQKNENPCQRPLAELEVVLRNCHNRMVEGHGVYQLHKRHDRRSRAGRDIVAEIFPFSRTLEKIAGKNTTDGVTELLHSLYSLKRSSFRRHLKTNYFQSAYPAP